MNNVSLATLIFVSGPQTGERVLLRVNRMEAGRVATAEILLKEETASRRQFTIWLSQDGWVLENLSENGTRVNSRRYKADKRILLDTGDVIGVAAESELLFVAAGDDAEEALWKFQQAHPSKAAPRAATTPAVAGAEPSSAPPVPAGDTAKLPIATAEAPTDALVARRRKIRKYVIGFGVYAVLLAGLAIVLSSRQPQQQQEEGVPPLLSDKQIAELLEARRTAPPDAALAGEMLLSAQRYYRDRNVSPGNLYKSVKCFQLHLAYRQAPDFESVDDAREYRHALDELATNIRDRYRNAYALERNGNWSRAQEEFLALLNIIPAKEEPRPEVKNALFDNIVAHLSYIRQHIRRK
jgi:pSer/pThr/pTyr-binding forkhead associated (FHA) protein